MKTSKIFAAALVCTAGLGARLWAQTEVDGAALKPDSVIYLPHVPTVAELSNLAASRGTPIASIQQMNGEEVVVYLLKNGQANTVVYRAIPPAGSAVAAPSVGPQDIPAAESAYVPSEAPDVGAVESQATPAVIYTQPAPAVVYEQPAPSYYYNYPAGYGYGGWAPSSFLSLAFGGGWWRGGYGYRGGYDYRGGYSDHDGYRDRGGDGYRGGFGSAGGSGYRGREGESGRGYGGSGRGAPGPSRGEGPGRSGNSHGGGVRH